MTVPFTHGRPLQSPAEAQAEHVAKTLERHPVTGPTSLKKYRLWKVTDALLSRLRIAQTELTEDGQEEAVGFYQEAIEKLESALRRQARD